MTYEETDKLCTELGIVLDCFSPLEISLRDDETGYTYGFATGRMAQIILGYLQEERAVNPDLFEDILAP